MRGIYTVSKEYQTKLNLKILGNDGRVHIDERMIRAIIAQENRERVWTTRCCLKCSKKFETLNKFICTTCTLSNQGKFMGEKIKEL